MGDDGGDVGFRVGDGRDVALAGEGVGEGRSVAVGDAAGEGVADGAVFTDTLGAIVASGVPRLGRGVPTGWQPARSNSADSANTRDGFFIVR